MGQSPGHTCPPLSFSETPLADSLGAAACCVDKASTWEKGHIGSDPRPDTHPVQPWASHFPFCALPLSVKEDHEAMISRARHQHP